MKTTEIYLIEDYDRLIKVVFKNGYVKHIDFMQGTDGATFESLLNHKGGNKQIKRILKTLTDNQDFVENGFKELDVAYKFNYAVELYCNAYIYQVL